MDVVLVGWAAVGCAGKESLLIMEQVASSDETVISLGQCGCLGNILCHINGPLWVLTLVTHLSV